MIPEIVGRFPVLTFLVPLDHEALRKILTEPKNALIKQFTKLFKMDGITLEFEEDAMTFIVEKATEHKLGARGLRSILEAILTDAMFELPSKGKTKHLKISRAYADEKFSKSNISRLKVA
jgi:ATP-dependent Clp protease ATP-binding subunit ClpX